MANSLNTVSTGGSPKRPLDLASIRATAAQIEAVYMGEDRMEETRIILRACVVEITGEDEYPGVVLPDGRILAWDKGGSRVSSYRDQAALMSEHPGAELHMFPDADEALNA